MEATIVGTKLDYFIILFYFVSIFAFGSYFAKFTRSTKDFFFGGQRFSWWLIAFSCIATTVGSYSFIKYSAAGFSYGLSSTMSYLNDWIIMPLFLLTWFPLIYFSRVASVPEYFEKRFDTKTRLIATLILLIYMVGYIGINLYTMGVAVNALMGTDVFWSSVVVALVCGIYVAAGGQTAVIMTDLLQGILLLVAGFVLFFLGLHFLGGWQSFWDALPMDWKLPMAQFNQPAEFHFVGVFWQDGIANNTVVYLINQGMLLRFLSLKSEFEGKKTFLFILLVLMPLAAIASANAGWLGKAMVEQGFFPADSNANKIFVLVTEKLCRPGWFGLMMAALTAALMSTIDTLINAVSVLWVNDLHRPYLAKGKSDRHYLKVARIVSLLAAFTGIALVPVFAHFKSIYVAHGAFIASVTPPMAMAVLLGALWRRYTAPAAFWTMLGGSIAIALSIVNPVLIAPFGHGIDPTGGDQYLRALYGLVVAGAIGIIVTFFTKPRPLAEVAGLVIGTLDRAREIFKGGPINEARGKPVFGKLQLAPTPNTVSLHLSAMAKLKANPGDLVYVTDRRAWLGGLRSVHARLSSPHAFSPDTILISPNLIQEGNLLAARPLKVEKIF